MTLLQFARLKFISFILLLALATVAVGGCAKKPYLSSATNVDQAYEECHALSEKKDYDEANECFEVLKSRFSGSRASYEADLEIGDNYFRKKEYLLAAETYLAFAKLHPAHEKIDYAYYRIGLSYLRESPRPVDRDQQHLEDALYYLELALSNPRSSVADVAKEKLMEVRTRIAKRHFYIGRFYWRTGEYLSAIPRFQEVVTHYSGLGLDEKSLYLMGRSYLGLSKKDKALDMLSVFEQHFPESPYRKRLAKKIGVQ